MSIQKVEWTVMYVDPRLEQEQQYTVELSAEEANQLKAQRPLPWDADRILISLSLSDGIIHCKMAEAGNPVNEPEPIRVCIEIEQLKELRNDISRTLSKGVPYDESHMTMASNRIAALHLGMQRALKQIDSFLGDDNAPHPG